MTAGLKQWMLLAALAAVLAAVVLYQMRGDAPVTPAATVADGTPAAGAPGESGGPVTDVRLDLLRIEPVVFAAPLRDPFRFRQPPAPAPRKVATAPPPPPPPAPAPRRATGPAPVTRPPISSSIRLLGIIEKGDMRVAVLHDGTANPPIHGVEGDIIEGRYRLLRVYPNAIDISYADGNGPSQRIPLPGR
jgi:hypothetical protein